MKIIVLESRTQLLQQYQVQIRRFEESITEVNARYERLEKKAVVLDQTVTGIDRAFESLKSLESSVREFREGISSMPGGRGAMAANVHAGSAPSATAYCTAMCPRPPNPATATLSPFWTWAARKGEYVVIPAQSSGATFARSAPWGTLMANFSETTRLFE